jgi:protein subunit release factor A
MVCTVFDDKHRIFLGTHRIQRVSSTEKQGRRHTSYVLVHEVIQNESNDLVRDCDIRVEPFKASGPGGQHRNKVESAIRMVHVPTGTTVIATEQRSQHQNRKIARARLLDRLAAGGYDEYRLPEQQWNWCQWRNKVSLPNGKKLTMTTVMRKGI